MNTLRIVGFLVFGGVVSVGGSALADDYERHVNEGIAALQTRDNSAALRAFGRAVALDPKRATAYYLRGRTYLAMREYEEAISDFSRAIDIRPAFAEAYLDRASARSATRDYTRGLEDAKTATRLLLDQLRRLKLRREALDHFRSPARKAVEEGMEADRFEHERRYRDFKQTLPASDMPAAEPDLESLPAGVVLG